MSAQDPPGGPPPSSPERPEGGSASGGFPQRGPESSPATPLGGRTPPPPPPPPLPGRTDDSLATFGIPRGEGAPALRPMRIGEMLDAAIRLYRTNYKTLMGIVAFVIVPYTFVEQAVVWRFTRPFDETRIEEFSGGDALALIFPVIGFLFIQPFVTAAIARATAEVYLQGKPDIRETYRFALSRWHSILLVTILSALASILGLLLLIVGAVFVFVRLYFATTVVVVEGEKGTSALRRSWQLAKGSFWKLFGTILLAGILTSIVAGILTLPVAFIATLTLEDSGWFLVAIGTSVAEVITAPFSSIIAVLLYFDLRIRKEGFDLALMARDLGHPAGGD